ncbi:hypothetical protein [Pseudotabrizicola sediminis]
MIAPENDTIFGGSGDDVINGGFNRALLHDTGHAPHAART